MREDEKKWEAWEAKNITKRAELAQKPELNGGCEFTPSQEEQYSLTPDAKNVDSNRQQVDEEWMLKDCGIIGSSEAPSLK